MFAKSSMMKMMLNTLSALAQSSGYLGLSGSASISFSMTLTRKLAMMINATVPTTLGA